MAVDTKALVAGLAEEAVRSRSEHDEQVARELEYKKDVAANAVEATKKRAEFLAGLITDGHTKLEEVLDPAFLEVASSQEAFNAAVRALEILNSREHMEAHTYFCFDGRR